MSTAQLQLSLIQKILTTFDEELLNLVEKTLSKPKKNSKSSKTTWENCNSPIREMTTEEAKIIAEFEANPQLVGVEETAKILKELKLFTNPKIKQ